MSYSLSAFKSYDIRGIYGVEIDEELAFLIGKVLPKILNANLIAVGTDARSSSPLLKISLVKGINESGASVIDIGECTTPMLNFTVVSKKLNGGVMISASHNPPEYNAFKIIASNALQLSSDSGLMDIKKSIEGKEYRQVNNNNSQNRIETVLFDYLSHLKSIFSVDKNIKVAVDFGNGMGSISTIPAFSHFQSITPVYLYKEVDCAFPNHLADPHNLENMKDLQKTVLENKCDLGIFFDGDADRCYFVDEKGDVVLADIAVCLLAENELKKADEKINKTIYYDLRFTKEIKNVVTQNGGTAVMMRVGNPFYKQKLIKEGGLLASEFSGHIMYKQNCAIDDGLFAALKMIQIISRSDKTLSTLLSKYKTYFSLPEISIEVKGKDIDSIFSNLKQKYIDGNEVVLDGLYIEYKDWWFNLRRSNTEPVVRLRIEANNENILELKKQEILSIINK